jgi:glutathione S-transferase
MKLYQSIGPNPRIVTMYVAEKGIAMAREMVDILSGVNRKPPFLAKNPDGTTPLLELDDSTFIAESSAICEYLEETQSGPVLIGSTPEERAITRMLMRRVDQRVIVPMTTGFRGVEGLPMFKDRVFCIPNAAADLKALARDGLAALDKTLAGKTWLAGDRFTLADIMLFCFVEFGGLVGQPVPDECKNLKAWQARVADRPSAAISANPENGI